jgi:hypothetical protein
MEIIMDVSDELQKEANKNAAFRKRIKAYLKKVNRCHDKFTVTDKDSYLGYITEFAVAEYLKRHYGDLIEVRTWTDQFDLRRIQKEIDFSVYIDSEIEYIVKYFYDAYDLEIIDKATGESIYVDVKTAETQRKPLMSWEFLYPVIQHQRQGKDCVILCYFYNTLEENKIILVGYMEESEISKCPIILEGQITRRNTVSQIDNYETKVCEYKRLSQMLEMHFAIRENR